MYIQDQLFIKLYASLQRTPLGDTLAGVPLGRDGVRAVLDLDPQDLNNRGMTLAGVAESLPQGTIDPALKLRYASQRWPGQVRLVRKTADGLLLCPKLAQAVQVDGKTLNDLADRKALYQQFVLLGQRLKNTGMDLRLVAGAWLWFLIDAVLSDLERRATDTGTTDQQLRKLLDDFGPGLDVVDRMLGLSVDQKKAIADARGALHAQIDEAQGQAADAEAATAIHHDLPIARAALLAAARRRMGQAGATATTDQAGATIGNNPHILD